MGSLEISYRTTMTMNTPEQVGMWLKSCRLERGMTQAELAKKAGVTQRLISDFERNKVVIRIDTLYRILRALGLILATIDPSIEPEQTDEEYPWEMTFCISLSMGYTWLTSSSMPISH